MYFKNSIITVIFIFSGIVLLGQCPTGQITLSSQSEINQFGEDYPNCEALGSLTIGKWLDSTNINNLTGLKSLKSITSKLIIINNPLLPDLTGLDSLTFIKGFRLENNDMLTNLSGLDNVAGDISESGILIADNDNLESISQLQNLEGVVAYLQFFNNDALVNLNGLNGITGVYSWGDGGIFIVNNDNLESLEGLGNLQFNWVEPLVGPNDPIPEYIHMRIWDNDNLTSLNGLGNFNHVFNLEIKNNNALPNLDGLHQDSLGYLILEANDALSSLQGLNPHNAVGALKIRYNDNFTSLSGLPDSSAVYLRSNNSLEDLSGIEDLDNLRYLSIVECDAFTSLNGIENIEHLEVFTSVRNHMLTSLSGLEHFDYITALILLENDGLLEINALEQIDSIRFVSITNHANLQSISELGHENTYFKGVWIENNPSLSICNAESICNFLENFSGEPQDVSIVNNASGCNSQGEVEAACMVPVDNLNTNSFFVSITPNPASGHFTLKAEGEKITDVRIYDAFGRLLKQISDDRFSMSVDVSSWQKGLYFVWVNGRYLRKVVVE